MIWRGFKDFMATIEINLEKSEEELFLKLDKDAKWGINKAVKSLLIVEVREDENTWKDFYEIYKETCLYGKIVPLDIEKVKEGKLFACIFEGKIIAGAVIKIQEKTITLFLNASQHDYLKFQPNNLLYWSIIKWGGENGYKIFDLGGYQAGAKPGEKLYDINRFKLRWGGEIKNYDIYSWNLFYILGRKVIRNFPLVKKTRDKIKMWMNKEKFKQ